MKPATGAPPMTYSRTEIESLNAVAMRLAIEAEAAAFNAHQLAPLARSQHLSDRAKATNARIAASIAADHARAAAARAIVAARRAA